MNEDQLSYKRATSVALIGLAIQAAVTLVLFFYARFGQDPGAMTAFWAVLLGLPIWISLALVFHQHRLERLEVLEAEAYQSSTAAQSTVFEEAGGEDLVQAAKLAWMHKWFLPAVSLVVGALYVILGFYRFFETREFTTFDGFVPPEQSGWAISISASVAVIGFVFARFVAGMAKQPVWSMLHAGSAAAVGAALVAAALGIAHFLREAIGYDLFLQYLPSVLGIYMMALGAEVFLNFVLNLYRPRRPGEYQRPAFDSRVLAFVAAPDRLAESISDAINYQFGFNVSSTWFYQLLQRSVGALVALGLLLMWGMSCFAVVEPHERGLLIQKGELVRELDSGLTIKMPWPLARVEKFPARAVNEIVIGDPSPMEDGPILWTNQHAGDESMFLIQPTPGVDVERASEQVDYALIVAQFPIHYAVDDLAKFVRLAQDGRRGNRDAHRHELLRAAASGAITRYMASLDVNEVLGRGRAEMSEDIRQIVQGAFDDLDAGVEVLFAGVAEVHPHSDVASSFEEVVGADQRRLTEIERARSEEIASLAEAAGSVEAARRVLVALDELDAMRQARAGETEVIRKEQEVMDLILAGGGRAADIISRARTERWEKHMSARAQLVASVGQVAAYRAAPIPFVVSKWLSALRQVSARSRVFIVPPEDVRVDVEYEEIEPMIGDLGSFNPDQEQPN